MHARGRIRNTLAMCLGVGALALGALTLAQPAANADINSARPIIPGPQCGPTLIWLCPDSDDTFVVFVGTVCEKNAFEQQSGLTCFPAGFPF